MHERVHKNGLEKPYSWYLVISQAFYKEWAEISMECSHSSANTLVPVRHVARTHQIDDKSKERKKKGVHQQRVLC